MQPNHISAPYFPQNPQEYASWVTTHGLLEPYGKCQCGCGQDAPISRKTSIRFGHRLNHPARYVAGHSARTRLNLEIRPPWVEMRGLRAPYGECQCGCGQLAPIAKQSDHLRGVVMGLPRQFIEGHARGWKRQLRLTPEERFWQKVKVLGPDECWEWQANTSNNGYGQFYVLDAGRNVPSHRFSYELHYGSIPEGLDVCHKCDNPACVNPNHLFAGTVSDNMQDMLRKGRNNPSRKIDENQKTAIRAMYATGNYTQEEIGRMYGVTQTLVGRIVRTGIERPFVRITNRKLNPEQVKEIRRLYASGNYDQYQLAERFGIGQCAISHIINRKTYVNL